MSRYKILLNSSYDGCDEEIDFLAEENISKTELLDIAYHILLTQLDWCLIDENGDVVE